MCGELYCHDITIEPEFNIARIKSGYTRDNTKTIIPSTAMVSMEQITTLI